MGSFLMMTCFLCTTISSGMFITAMAANPLAVNLAAETLGYTISWGAPGWQLRLLAGGEFVHRSASLPRESCAADTRPHMVIASSPALPAGTWALAGLVPGAVCLLLTPALLYVLYPPEVKDTPDAPAKVSYMGLQPCMPHTCIHEMH